MESTSDAELNRLLLRYREKIAKIGQPTVDFESPNIQAILQKYQEDNRLDEYYYIVDVTKYQIIWSHGIDKWLGHPIAQHNFDFHVKLIHPFMKRWYIYFAIGIYELLFNDPELFKKYPSIRFTSNLPIRNAKGSYTCVKQIGMPLQLDQNGQMVSHFNIHQVMDGYRGHPLRPRIFDGINRCHELEIQLLKTVANLIHLHPDEQLSSLELQTLRLCYEHKNDKNRNEIIQKAINMTFY
jgi:hypothetical protein